MHAGYCRTSWILKRYSQLDLAILKTCISEALQLTAPYGEAIQLFPNYGASPDQDGDGGFKFLQQVMKQGSSSSVKMLLEVTSLNPLQLFPFMGNHHHFTSLIETAAAYWDLEMVKQILETDDVDFHSTNEECQQAALSSALSWQRIDNIHKSVEAIKYFLDHGF